MTSGRCLAIMRSIGASIAAVSVVNVRDSPTLMWSSGLMPNHSRGSAASSVCWPEHSVVTCEWRASSRMTGASLIASGRVPTTQRNRIIPQRKPCRNESALLIPSRRERREEARRIAAARFRTAFSIIFSGYCAAGALAIRRRSSYFRRVLTATGGSIAHSRAGGNPDCSRTIAECLGPGRCRDERVDGMTDGFDSAERNAGRRDRRVISIRGAREHNLKNVDLDIPRDRLVVFTGLSGSGKSSLAFDTIYAEGQRRYVESLSAYARQFLEMMQKPDVDQIDGLSPAISIEQKTTSRNPRSTVGTVTEIYDYMRLLWARVGVPYSPATGLPIESQTVSQMVDRILALPEGTRLYLLAPVVRGRKGEYRKELAEYLKKGFQRVKVDGAFHEIAAVPALDKKFTHDIDVVVDRIVVRPDISMRLADSLKQALKLADGLAVADVADSSPLAGGRQAMKARQMGPAAEKSYP